MLTDLSMSSVAVVSRVSTAADARTERRLVEADARTERRRVEAAREEDLRPGKVGREEVVREAGRLEPQWCCCAAERERVAWDRLREEEDAMALE